VPIIEVQKDDGKYIGPYSWIIIFVGDSMHDLDFDFIKEYKKRYSNYNLIIVGINMERNLQQCEKYDTLCRSTNEGFFVNIDLS
jgi:hypothetical protein